MAVTLKDIAREAGVSVALVSFVMNNRVDASGKAKYRVAQATRDRILEVAGRLGYRPAGAAPLLQRGPVRVIGILLPDLSDGFSGRLAQALEKALLHQGYLVLFGSTGNDPERFGRLTQAFQEKGLDGVIAVLCPGCESYWLQLRQTGIPAVSLDIGQEENPDLLARQSTDALLYSSERE